VLAILADFMGFARCSLSRPLFIVESSTMLLLEALDILVLRHPWLVVTAGGFEQNLLMLQRI